MAVLDEYPGEEQRRPGKKSGGVVGNKERIRLGKTGEKVLVVQKQESRNASRPNYGAKGYGRRDRANEEK